MQGRLSPLVQGRIQAFPHEHWRQEFPIANNAKFSKIEWTIDSIKFDKNPLLTKAGQNEICAISTKYNVAIPSVTCDYFMENPPWKQNELDIESDINRIIQGMSTVGANVLVIPLVDNSSVKSNPSISLQFFLNMIKNLDANEVKIAFEVDLNASETVNFINEFPEEYFGINYDIGNSAALGHEPLEELTAYGKRVINVHVKDRVLGGTTVRLGCGDADFSTVTKYLQNIEYNGNYIMQTARSIEGEHFEELSKNIFFFQKYLSNER